MATIGNPKMPFKEIGLKLYFFVLISEFGLEKRGGGEWHQAVLYRERGKYNNCHRK